MADDALPTILQLTPMDDDYRRDPAGVLARLRSACPVHHDAFSGATFVSRYADVRGVATDLTLWRDPLLADPDSRRLQRFDPPDPSLPRSETSSILTLDDPDHARIRGPLSSTPGWPASVPRSSALSTRLSTASAIRPRST